MTSINGLEMHSPEAIQLQKAKELVEKHSSLFIEKYKKGAQVKEYNYDDRNSKQVYDKEGNHLYNKIDFYNDRTEYRYNIDEGGEVIFIDDDNDGNMDVVKIDTLNAAVNAHSSQDNGNFDEYVILNDDGKPKNTSSTTNEPDPWCLAE